MALDDRDWYRDELRKKQGYTERAAFRRSGWLQKNELGEATASEDERVRRSWVLRIRPPSERSEAWQRVAWRLAWCICALYLVMRGIGWLLHR